MQTYFLKKTSHFLLLSVLCFSSLVFGEWEADANAVLLKEKWANKFFFEKYEFTGHEQILDVGCGDGKLTHLLANKAPEGNVIGLDSSNAKILHAEQIYKKSNLSFKLGDASLFETYSDYENFFDLVVSFHCLHWVDSQEHALAGIHHAIKSGGKAFLRLTSNGWDPIQVEADQLIYSKKWSSYFEDFKNPIHRFSVIEYNSLVQQAGFTLVSLNEAIEDEILPDLETLKSQVGSWLPHVKHLPHHLQKDFLDELAENYLAKIPKSSDGFVHLHDCYLEVELQK